MTTAECSVRRVGCPNRWLAVRRVHDVVVGHRAVPVREAITVDGGVDEVLEPRLLGLYGNARRVEARKGCTSWRGRGTWYGTLARIYMCCGRVWRARSRTDGVAVPGSRQCPVEAVHHRLSFHLREGREGRVHRRHTRWGRSGFISVTDVPGGIHFCVHRRAGA